MYKNGCTLPVQPFCFSKADMTICCIRQIFFIMKTEKGLFKIVH